MSGPEKSAVLGVIQTLEELSSRVPRWQLDGIQHGPNGRDSDIVSLMRRVDRVLARVRPMVGLPAVEP